MVAALARLICSLRPLLHAADVVTIIRKGSDDLAPKSYHTTPAMAGLISLARSSWHKDGVRKIGKLQAENESSGISG